MMVYERKTHSAFNMFINKYTQIFFKCPKMFPSVCDIRGDGWRSICGHRPITANMWSGPLPSTRNIGSLFAATADTATSFIS